MSKTKGTTLVTLVKFLRKQPDRARAALPPSLHKYLDERIHPSSWYPEADLLALLRAMLGMLPGARDAMLEQLGAALAREHLEGIYGHLKPDASSAPSTMARRCFALWSSQHDTGMLAMSVDGGHAVLEIRDFALPSPEMCGILTGYFREAFRQAGASDLQLAKERCRLAGAQHCSWVATWKP
jgi:hypothetical protein